MTLVEDSFGLSHRRLIMRLPRKSRRRRRTPRLSLRFVSLISFGVPEGIRDTEDREFVTNREPIAWISVLHLSGASNFVQAMVSRRTWIGREDEEDSRAR